MGEQDVFRLDGLACRETVDVLRDQIVETGAIGVAHGSTSPSTPGVVSLSNVRSGR